MNKTKEAHLHHVCLILSEILYLLGFTGKRVGCRSLLVAGAEKLLHHNLQEWLNGCVSVCVPCVPAHTHLSCTHSLIREHLRL